MTGIVDDSRPDIKSDPLTDYVPVTPANTELPDGPCRAIIVAAAGTVNLTTIKDEDRDGVPLQPGINPIVAKKIRAGGTATNLFAGY